MSGPGNQLKSAEKGQSQPENLNAAFSNSENNIKPQLTLADGNRKLHAAFTYPNQVAAYGT